MLVPKGHLKEKYSKFAINMKPNDRVDENTIEIGYSGLEFKTNHLEDSEISTKSGWTTESAIAAAPNTDESSDDCAL